MPEGFEMVPTGAKVNEPKVTLCEEENAEERESAHSFRVDRGTLHDDVGDAAAASGADEIDSDAKDRRVREGITIAEEGFGSWWDKAGGQEPGTMSRGFLSCFVFC